MAAASTDAAAPAPSSASPVALPECNSEQEVVETFNRLRQEQGNIMSRIAEVEAERHDHALVIEALKPLEATRRCHRLVGGVLVERTVGEVLPAVTESLTNFDLLLKNLNAALVSKERELQGFIAKYKIQFRNDALPQQQAAQQQQGVLA